MSAGVVLVATGAETYIELAARAAASVKRHCPGLPVDLYTDADRQLPAFDRVHRLDDPWFRSKIDALLNSRFARTLYMDADMLALADFRDVFEVLERNNGNRTQTARDLGVDPRTVFRYLEREQHPAPPAAGGTGSGGAKIDQST